MRLDEVVVDELELVQRCVSWPGLNVGVAVLDGAPGQHRRAGRHRQAELDVVARVVPAAGQVAPDVRAVRAAGVAAPADAVARAGPRALGLVEPDGLLQRFAVVECLGKKLRRAKRQARRKNARAPPCAKNHVSPVDREIFETARSLCRIHARAHCGKSLLELSRAMAHETRRTCLSGAATTHAKLRLCCRFAGRIVSRPRRAGDGPKAAAARIFPPAGPRAAFPLACARNPQPRRGGRAVECTGLENRQPLAGLVGSNLTPSARSRECHNFAEPKLDTVASATVAPRLRRFARQPWAMQIACLSESSDREAQRKRVQ